MLSFLKKLVAAPPEAIPAESPVEPFLLVLFTAAITAAVQRPVRIRHITIRQASVEHHPWSDGGRQSLHHSHGRN